MSRSTSPTSGRRSTRRAAGAGLSALLLAAGLAAGSAATATTATAASPSASAGLVQAMQQDLGLTEDQALTRLAQEAAATDLEPLAEQAAGDAFAGSWFDADSGALTVAVTGPEAAADVEATGAEAEVVTHSATLLDATKAEIDDLGEDAPAGVAGWGVDVRDNSVVVHLVEGMEDAPGVQEFVAEAEAAGPVSVVADAPEQPGTFAAGTVGGDRYWTNTAGCSIGFSVHGGFVTAGHCGSVGQAVRGWDNTHIGHFQGSSFPGDDLGWVNVGSGWWTVPVVIGWGAIPDQLVRGSAEAPIGSSICRSGATTGWHCGTVLSKNDTVNYDVGPVYQMTGTTVCAEPGDSGGAYLTGDQAQGVTSGGYGNCRDGGRTWFQPVNEILDRYGLTLHTA
ncbi:S1 family peptidase [Streptomyces bohaiensis]|uniref:S1 family peptidase n=1 Tax=Streptomyces bohaiensis TaxID=1431344 RepID=A0ABX1CLH2_9ACTN|nr:S1 family peptidase [Streptomyces bohaiensis]NJQ17977.1 S1 family peptidase [Streptomyces bohaiensis]